MVTEAGGPRIASTSAEVWPFVTTPDETLCLLSMAPDWFGAGAAALLEAAELAFSLGSSVGTGESTGAAVSDDD